MGSILAATWAGLLRAASLPRLVATVWLIHLALSAAAVYPTWRSLREVVGPLPEADVLGVGFPLGALGDLAELRPGLLPGFGFTLAAVAILGAVVGAVVSGGVLEVLRSRDDRPLGHRFGRGAGRFFGRFVGVGLVVVVTGGVAGVLTLGPLVALARSSFRSMGAPSLPAVIGGVVLGVGLTVLLHLVLDVSRIVVVRTDGGVLASVRAGLGMVLRRPWIWTGAWLANAALVALVLVLYLLLRQVLPSPAPLAALVVLQQGLIVTRIVLRLWLLASESYLVDALAPASAPSAGEPAQPDLSFVA